MPNWTWTEVTIKKPKVSEAEFRDMVVYENDHVRTDRLYEVSPQTYLNFDMTNKMRMIEKDKDYHPKQLIAVTTEDFPDAMFVVNPDNQTNAEERMNRTVQVVGEFTWAHLMHLGDKWTNAEFRAVMDKFEHKHGNLEFFDWYSWNVKNLGCKWEFDLLDLEFDKDEIRFRVDTPWGPPFAWLKKLAKFTGGTVDIEYTNEGDGFYVHTGPGKCTLNNTQDDFHDCNGCEFREQPYRETIELDEDL